MRALRGRCVPALALLVTLAVDQHAAEAQSTDAVAVARFLGAWELVDWRATDGTGTVRFPYGESAQGQITYSADGRMSAHLMRPPENPADAPPQHLSYWGTFSLQTAEGTVTHHVIGSSQANWIGSDQVRRFTFEGDDRLILALGTNRLTWERVR
ncbi:MAG: lipocalin-like domain-containing protein [Gemmatimonadota bacterium]